MKTTREAELELLELARDEADNIGSEGKTNRRNSILESVFEQTKDPTIEKMRNELARWVRYGLRHVPEEDEAPTDKQKRALAEAQINIDRIEKDIHRYIESPGVRDSIIKKMHRHDPIYAESIVIKQKRRLK